MKIKILHGTPAAVAKSANELIRSNPNWKPTTLSAAGTKAVVSMHLDETGHDRVDQLQILSGTPAKVEDALTSITNPGWRVAAIAPIPPTEKKTETACLVLITLPVL